MKTEDVYVGKDAYGFAAKKAKYGHADWIVWKLIDGNACAAKLTLESLLVAVSECARLDKNRPAVDLMHASTGQGLRASDALVEIWKRNLQSKGA